MKTKTLTLALAITLPSLALAQDGYPEIFEGMYLEGCMEEDGESMRPFCECSYDKLQENIPFNEFLTLMENTQNGVPQDTRFTNAILACIDKMPG